MIIYIAKEGAVSCVNSSTVTPRQRVEYFPLRSDDAAQVDHSPFEYQGLLQQDWIWSGEYPLLDLVNGLV
jgi:hypothetical protein